MPRLERHPESTYTAFATGLFDPSRDTPSAVAGPQGHAAAKRYNVYRNNVTVSLIETLAAIYPAVQRITGADFFRAMARSHIRATPPTSPLLFDYGRDFPAFIQQWEYAQSMPWLADTARLERAWLDAYHAADVEPLSSDALAATRESWEPQTTARNLRLIREARARRNEATDWIKAIEDRLVTKASTLAQTRA